MTWYYVPYTSAPAMEASSWPSDTPEWNAEPWLTLNGTPTQRPSSWNGWSRRGWIRLLSGLTCSRSTLERGAAEWISSLPVSPVSRSRWQVNSAVLTMTGGFGLPSDGSSVRWDRDACSWRTSPSLFDSGYLTSLPTLPTSGSMRNGVCSQRLPLEPRTSDNDSGFSLWPTATSTDFKASGGNPNGTGTHGTTLTDRAVRMWGTPVANDDQKSPEAHLAMKARMGGGRKEPTSLTVQSKMWPNYSHHAPTTTTDGNNGSPKADLNPRFVAALMGVPWDWLILSTSAATDSSHR